MLYARLMAIWWCPCGDWICFVSGVAIITNIWLLVIAFSLVYVIMLRYRHGNRDKLAWHTVADPGIFWFGSRPHKKYKEKNNKMPTQKQSSSFVVGTIAPRPLIDLDLSLIISDDTCIISTAEKPHTCHLCEHKSVCYQSCSFKYLLGVIVW